MSRSSIILFGLFGASKPLPRRVMLRRIRCADKNGSMFQAENQRSGPQPGRVTGLKSTRIQWMAFGGGRCSPVAAPLARLVAASRATDRQRLPAIVPNPQLGLFGGYCHGSLSLRADVVGLISTKCDIAIAPTARWPYDGLCPLWVKSGHKGADCDDCVF